MGTEPVVHGDPPVRETCGICDEDVPYSLTVHVLVHTGTDEGVVDYYVCRNCYQDQVAPLFEASDDAEAAGEVEESDDDEGVGELEDPDDEAVGESVGPDDEAVGEPADPVDTGTAGGAEDSGDTGG